MNYFDILDRVALGLRPLLVYEQLVGNSWWVYTQGCKPTSGTLVTYFEENDSWLCEQHRFDRCYHVQRVVRWLNEKVSR